MKNQESYTRFAVFSGAFGIRPLISISLSLLAVSVFLSFGIIHPF